MEKFNSNFESLRNFECPEWFKDAKFGIWSHWGPQSVPMAGDWYARNMYREGSEQYNYHIRHYGHPSEFGYKDIAELWKAENFNPDELMELYQKAGARYFVAQAMHHDNFFNYDSELHDFNSKKVGPKKDICMLWKKSAEKFDMPFGLTEHLSASFTWWRTNKWSDQTGPFKGVPYDGSNPEFSNIYYDNDGENVIDTPENRKERARPWYTKNKNFHQYWRDVMHELIEKFEPDLLYTDGGLPFAEVNIHAVEQVPLEGNLDYAMGLEVVSELYNKSIEKYGENRAVYNQKDRRPEVYNVGILDIEKSQLPGILPEPWQTDTCIGNWFYDARAPRKGPDQIIEMLVDIISKNGSMLLNILQLPDGNIDAQARWVLEELAKWFEICGQAVHGTRPFRIFGEGDTRVKIDGFTENKTEFNSSDWRFTSKDNILYAFMLAVPQNGVAVIKSLQKDEKVKAVELLGFGELKFNQSFGTLCVELPDQMPTEYTNCLKITF